MRKFLFLLVLTFFGESLQAQFIVGFETNWSDSFVEWTLFEEEEDNDGFLRLRWLTQEDWTEWEYRIMDSFGQIKQRFKGDQNEWELRGDGQIVTMRTLFRGNFREWRITDNSKTLRFKTKFGNLSDEWILDNSRNGIFDVYTNFEGDPRAWTIADELDEDISFEMKMAMIFISIYYSTPKQ
jgi:hypothetical protein